MPAPLNVLRWLARLSALVVTGGFVMMVAGELFSPHSGSGPGPREWAGIALLAATCAGMMLAWRWELPGAGLSLLSLAGFTLLITFTRHTVHLVLATPGILFLADWLLRRRAPGVATSARSA